jgi:hypothetical protein
MSLRELAIESVDWFQQSVCFKRILFRLLHRLCESSSTLTTGSQSLACGYYSIACCTGSLRAYESIDLLQHRQRSLTLLIEIQTDVMKQYLITA